MIKLLLMIALAAMVRAEVWVLYWSDEFDGTSLNTSNWNFDLGNNNGWGNNELQCYTNNPSNLFLSDGYLYIQALQESYQGFNYTSARINTQGLFMKLYGKFEIRAKLPNGHGTWPAFWMLGENVDQVGWPACGNIDVMETVGREQYDIFSYAKGTNFSIPNIYYNSSGFNSDFHIFGVNWQPESLEFYVDNTTYAKATPADIGSAQWPFDAQNFFILLNLAIGGNWPGPPDGTSFPQQYIIDYVRVWEREV